jgi:uncharacterized protein (TIGR03118 family)
METLKQTGNGKRNLVYSKRTILFAGSAFMLFVLLGEGCKKAELGEEEFEIAATNYVQVNLVADRDGYNALRVDPKLVNPWGMTIEPTGEIWIASEEPGLALIYDANGNALRRPVNIGADRGPTGIVTNLTGTFVIPQTRESSRYIFANEDGTISAYSSGDAAYVVVDRSASRATYKGLALATNNGHPYIYATNFRTRKIEVFDEKFNLVSMPFRDPSIPSNFAPYNIANLNGNLYVTYAMRDAEGEDEIAGAAQGFVSIFRPDGTFVRRFASRGPLNAPWGIALQNTRIYVGNFGDGRISVYTMSGDFLGQLTSGTRPVQIEGLWAIGFNRSADATNGQLYFTAGPGDEAHGLFGYLKQVQ